MTERPAGPLLSNPRSDRIRAIRALSGRSVRARTRRFLIEGPQAVREAVRYRAADEVLITPEASARYPEIPELAAQSSARVRNATADVVAVISKDAQGIIAVGPQPEVSLMSVLKAQPRLLVVLSESQDPGNTGTIIRTADAAGADAVILTRGSVEVFNPKVVRATAGSLFHLPVVTGGELGEILTAIQSHNVCVLAADGAGFYDLDELQSGSAKSGAPNLSESTAWLFGNEARGLLPAAVTQADASVAVPIHGAAQSLNLATAAAICLYASARAQRGAKA